jgi:hypothetical protein
MGGQVKRLTRIARIKNAALAAGVVGVLAACGSPPHANTAVDLKSLRSSAKGSADGEKTGHWLLDEMLAPGGTSKNADDARAQLDRAKDKGLYASIAGGLYDETHEIGRAHV